VVIKCHTAHRIDNCQIVSTLLIRKLRTWRLRGYWCRSGVGAIFASSGPFIWLLPRIHLWLLPRGPFGQHRRAVCGIDTTKGTRGSTVVTDGYEGALYTLFSDKSFFSKIFSLLYVQRGMALDDHIHYNRTVAVLIGIWQNDRDQRTFLTVLEESGRSLMSLFSDCLVGESVRK